MTRDEAIQTAKAVFVHWGKWDKARQERAIVQFLPLPVRGAITLKADYIQRENKRDKDRMRNLGKLSN